MTSNIIDITTTTVSSISKIVNIALGISMKGTNAFINFIEFM